MQVTQRDTHITHAVIGQQESVSMGMSDDAALMMIFSQSLYTYPMLAAVREPICNAWDAHITGGCTDKPLKITISATEFKVQDFGTGIPHDKIGSIYGTYGKSTKRDDSTVTGGFGLGSKAPFAYTDNFEVVSCHGGLKSIYRVSKSSMEVGGKPSINLVVQIPTEETGITVSFHIKSSDGRSLLNLVEAVVDLGGISANINDKAPREWLPVAESPTGYLINNYSGTNLSRINMRVGNVVYPIPDHESYKTEFLHLLSSMNRLDRGTNIIFMAPPDAVTIAPSRENLILSSNTVDTIKAMLGKFKDQTLKNCAKAVGDTSAHLVNKAIKKIKPAAKAKDIAEGVFLDRPTNVGLLHSSGPYAYTLKRAYFNHLFLRSDTRDNSTKTQFKLLDKLIQSKTVDVKFAKDLRRAWLREIYNKGRYSPVHHMVASVHRHVSMPVRAMIEANPALNFERVFYGVRDYNWGCPELRDFRKLKIRAAEDGLAFLFKKVLIVRSKTAANDFFNREARHDRDLAGWIVYMVTSKVEMQESVTKAFEAMGYVVHNHVPETVPRPVKEPFVGPMMPKDPVRRKGYLTLASSWNTHHTRCEFLQSTARENTKVGDEIKDPIAWVQLYTKKDGAGTFSIFTKEESMRINDQFGQQIAVVTNGQSEILMKRGIPRIDKFIFNYVDSALMARPDLPRYLAFARFLEDMHHNEGCEVMAKMVVHPQLMDKLGLRFAVSAETMTLLTFLDVARRNDTHLPKVSAMMNKVKKHPQVYTAVKKMAASPWLEFIDMGMLSRRLSSASPDSPEAAIPCEIISHLLK